MIRLSAQSTFLAELADIQKVWPGSIVTLCSWHVDKDINEWFTVYRKEKVKQRNMHAWSTFVEELVQT